MKSGILFGTVLSIILVTFSYGFLAGVYEYFPYNELSNIKKIILSLVELIDAFRTSNVLDRKSEWQR